MNKKGLFLVLTTALISGISIYINKFGVVMGSPVVYVFLKNSLVALALLAIVLGVKNRKELKKINLKKWGMLWLIGLIGGSIPFILFFKGLAMTSAAQGSLIHKTMFIFVALLAAVFLKERLNKYFLGGAMLILLGNLLVIKNLSLSVGLGDGLILMATLFWAVENIMSKHVLRSTSSEIVATGRMFFGSFFILIYIFFTQQAGEIFSLNLQQISWSVITAFFLLGYVLTWYKGLAKIPVSVATSVLLLGAPVTTFLTVFSVGKINESEFISSLFIILGVFSIIFFNYEKNKNQKESPIRA